MKVQSTLKVLSLYFLAVLGIGMMGVSVYGVVINFGRGDFPLMIFFMFSMGFWFIIFSMSMAFFKRLKEEFE